MAPHLRWTASMEDKLAEILNDMSETGVCLTSMKNDLYGTIASRVNMDLNLNVSWIQVRTHIKQTKTKFQMARKAIHASGFGIMWDAVKMVLTADEDSWARYTEGAGPTLKGLRNKAFKLYDTFYKVFGDEGATGSRGVTSGRDIPDENEQEAPTELEDDFASNNVGESQEETPTENEGGGNTQAGRQKRPRRERGSSSGRNQEKMDAMSIAMQTISVSLERKAAVAENDSGFAKEARFTKAMSELWTIGLPGNLPGLAVTLIVNNPGYKDMYMSISKEVRLEVVSIWLKNAGHLD